MIPMMMIIAVAGASSPTHPLAAAALISLAAVIVLSSVALHDLQKVLRKAEALMRRRSTAHTSMTALESRERFR